MAILMMASAEATSEASPWQTVSWFSWTVSSLFFLIFVRWKSPPILFTGLFQLGLLFLFPLPTDVVFFKVACAALLFTAAIGEFFFLLPLAVPYVSYIAFVEFIAPSQWLFESSLLFLLATTCLFPPLLIRLWGCQRIESPIFEDLFATTKFRCEGIYSWESAKDELTAAIFGVFWRYILFSPQMLLHFPQKELVAVCAHEIGHAKKKHLLLSLYLLMGLFPLELLIGSQNIFVCLALSAFYVRFIFAIYLRAFERQADLFPLTIGIDPNDLISALYRISQLSGIDLLAPSWHHYSIQERIDCIRRAAVDSTFIPRHDRYVRCLLSVATALFFIFFLIMMRTV